MTDITIYSSNYCPFCIRAKQLLGRKGLAYNEINVDGQPGVRADMARRAGRTSVPQIWINDIHVVAAMNDNTGHSGKLDTMLADDCRTGELDSARNMADEQQNNATPMALTNRGAIRAQRLCEGPVLRSRAPEVFKPVEPHVNLDLNTRHTQLQDGIYEVLRLTTVTNGDEDVTIAEVQQAGIFAIGGLDEASMRHTLGAFCPNICFPMRAGPSTAWYCAAASCPDAGAVNFDALFAQSEQRRLAEQNRPTPDAVCCRTSCRQHFHPCQLRPSSSNVSGRPATHGTAHDPPRFTPALPDRLYCLRAAAGDSLLHGVRDGVAALPVMYRAAFRLCAAGSSEPGCRTA